MLLYHFVLILYSLYTQVMLILNLIDVWQSQKAVFSFLKRFKWSKSLHLRFPLPSKKIPPTKCLISDTGGNPHTPYHYLENPVQVLYDFVLTFLFSPFCSMILLWTNSLVVKVLDSQSRGPAFKTTRWLQSQLSLSSFRG